MNSTSPDIVTIRPLPGRTVLDPFTRRVIPDGYRVVLDSYWIRRIKDGDVEVLS